MNQKNERLELIKCSSGVFRTADLYALGINAYGIRRLLERNKVEHIKHGYYRFIDGTAELSEAAQISQLFPEGVLCMYSALFYYGYSDRVPAAWDIAIDKNTSKSRFKLDYPYIQPHYTEPRLLSFGIVPIEYDNGSMMIYDRDRLICECIFFENKMDNEAYNKAIQGYILDSKKNIAQLLEYAEKRRILKKVKERIGVWL